MKPILISGAGLGGLLLARSLKSNNIPFELYERDAHVAARGQGYRLRISTDGMNALKSILTPSEYEHLFEGTSKTGGGGIHSLDALTAEMKSTSRPGLGGDVLGVARTFLRSELIRGLESQVYWNKHAVGYQRLDDGVRILFEDGSSSEGSLLIAADGPHSAITNQLTAGKVRAYDTGARMIHGQSPARSFAQLGEGVWFAYDMSNPNATIAMITNVKPGTLDTDVECGWIVVGSPGAFDAPGGDFKIHGQVAADLSRQLTSKWHSSIRPVFEQQDDAEAAFLKMSTATPEGIPDWETDSRVTTMGDAVHCMTPAGGVGANTALRDGALLGKLIAEKGGWDEGIVEAYEKEMRVYASKNVKMSFDQAAERFKITELK